MEKPDNSALAFDASKVKLGTNYLLVGSDPYLIDRVISQIKHSLKKKSEIDVSTVYGDEVKATDLGEYLDTFTIFSSSKLVIIKNAEMMLKKELEVVADYFNSPSDIQSLIVVTEKTDAKFNAWKAILSGSVKVICDPPKFVSEIRNWLLSEIRKEGRSMEPIAITEFTNRVEMDYLSAANELAKLLLLVGDRKQITAKDLLTSLSGNRAGTQIDFFRAMGGRQVKSALESCALMLQTDVEPLQIFFSIYRFFMNLYRINLLRERHLSDTEIQQKHISDIYYSQRKEYLDFARKYSLNALEAIFGILLETDSLLKSSLADKNLQIELCIIQALNTK
ncbi:MAG: DNA polymerase III subunit delta [Candidatus Cloacimonetes bacterium]|jgi:DNA polymerase-3 subunit delta|nr:DNA polymerase III subunit delta [Candidatus Cloacimonadota bacterium]MDD2507101.1 DNA polymerase III subunit delta [Candidatus Cloacimonadota bacterium]MDD4147165.1 DNA polymerase III subunit delta [Candidatus Cloacimonadota bacterium]MDD4560580.1 DNA polymerase III subunit delta [Candidatus Cloacimonadota bacterium]